MEATGSHRSRAAIHVPELAALWHQHLDIHSGPAGPIAVLQLAGDVDAFTLPLACAALVTALETQPTQLVVDLSDVRFCGIRGFLLLARRARTTAADGIGFVVTGIGPHLDRAANRIWSEQRVIRRPTIAAAMITICSAQLTAPMTAPGAAASAHGSPEPDVSRGSPGSTSASRTLT